MTTKQPTVNIEELRALLDKSASRSPAPWRVIPRDSYAENDVNEWHIDDAADVFVADFGDGDADAALICAARNALGPLLDELERLRQVYAEGVR